MTGMAAVRRRVVSPTLAAVLVLAVAAALGFLTGVLPAEKWRPFLYLSTWTYLAPGLLTTVLIGGSALVGSIVIGLGLAFARIGLPGIVRWLIVTWVELVRATPILAILLITYLAPRRLGVDITFIQAAIVGLTIYNSAVLAEIFRAGILSIARGEIEAARSLGLSAVQTMRHVILPQAIGRMMPAIVSQLITLNKDTTLASVISVRELLGLGRSFWNFYGNLLETSLVLLLIFFAINYPLSLVSRRLEARQPKEERITVLGEEDQVKVAA